MAVIWRINGGYGGYLADKSKLVCPKFGYERDNQNFADFVITAKKCTFAVEFVAKKCLIFHK